MLMLWESSSLKVLQCVFIQRRTEEKSLWTHPTAVFFILAQRSRSVKRKTCLTFLELSDTSTRKPSFTSWRAWKDADVTLCCSTTENTKPCSPAVLWLIQASVISTIPSHDNYMFLLCLWLITCKNRSFKGPKNTWHTITHTSPLGVVTAVLRGSISSLMEERKFWEIRRASCSSGKSGWSLGVCFSRSCTMSMHVTNVLIYTTMNKKLMKICIAFETII